MSTRNKLIIFFVPPQKLVNGGILSIFSLAEVSRQFKMIHGSEVVISTYPGHASYRKNDLFENNEIVYSFDELVKRGTPQSLMLHVPELASHDVFQELKKYAGYIQGVENLSVNIMLQNILLMQPSTEVANWFSLSNDVTMTTGHNKYSSQELADRYSLPVKHLSVYNDPSQYSHTPYEDKKRLILLSPDVTDKKRVIVKKLEEEMPECQVTQIQNMKYEDYKKLMAQAKYTVTFGEGFDGYFIEAFFSGGITFAVYNDDFFPAKDFAAFENTYRSFDEMERSIVNDMKRLDNKQAYEKVVAKNLKIIKKLYDYNAYKKNIQEFYQRKFTYLPSPGSATTLIGEIIKERNQLISERDIAIQERDKTIDRLSRIVAERDRVIREMENSHSWKLTRPLRKSASALRRKRPRQ